MEHPAGPKGPVRGFRVAARAIRIPPDRDRNQFVALPATRLCHLRAMGRSGSAHIPVRRQDAEIDFSRAVAHARVAGRFFDLLRSMHGGDVVCEPRHATWGHASGDEVAGEISHRSSCCRPGEGGRPAGPRRVGWCRLFQDAWLAAHLFLLIFDRKTGSARGDDQEPAAANGCVGHLRQHRVGCRGVECP